MSDKCPLCRNSRLEDSIFCADCTKKVQSDYEVMLPKSKDNITEPKVELNSESVPYSQIDKNIITENEVADEIADDSNSVNDKSIEEKRYNDSNVYPTKKSNKSKKLLRIVIAILILIGLYFTYYEVILEKNLERSAWETAVKENSVNGYLTYIEKHPSGTHFEEAQEGLMNLKQTEASMWEKLKVSENISELTGFITQFNNSPYLPLAEIRLDSLSWMVALKTNSAESYYEYIEFSRHGELRGVYTAEAQKRYNWLYQSTHVDVFELDSIRSTVSGFYSALSSLDHTGMYSFLATHVQRFFDSGGASKEKITGELVMSAAQTNNSKISFSPVIEGLQYKKTGNGFYEVNVPLVKSYTESNRDILIPGYIVHITLNPAFEITIIYETKPYSGAP